MTSSVSSFTVVLLLDISYLFLMSITTVTGITVSSTNAISHGLMCDLLWINLT